MPGTAEHVGETHRRPAHRRSAFVAQVLTHVRAHGFEGAPLTHGIDEDGRQVFDWIVGEVPPTSPFRLGLEQQRQAALLIRAFHDAAASMPGLGAAETVEHGDLGPHNTVFHRGSPVALIDWDDDVRPGSRATDFAQAVWGFADLLEPEVAVGRQREGLETMCRAYGLVPADRVLDELGARFGRAIGQHRAAGLDRAAAVFEDLLRRLDEQRPALLGPRPDP